MTVSVTDMKGPPCSACMRELVLVGGPGKASLREMKIELGILSIEMLWDIFCGSQLFLCLVVILSYTHRNIFQKYSIK